MASKETIRQVLAILSVEYPDHVNKMSPEQLSNLRGLYQQVLADIDDETLKAAALRHISSSQWFPKVSELREAAVRVTRPPVPDALEAWGAVKAAFLSVGSYNTPHFDDPLTEAVVKQMGWRDLCLSEDGTADRARFVDAYQRQAQRAHGQDVLPAGLQDGALGYPLLPAGGAQAVIARLAEAKRP